MICDRCRQEIETANRMDHDPQVDRGLVAVVAGEEYRRLSPVQWTVFEILYRALDRMVPSPAIADGAGIPGEVRQTVMGLRRKLDGTRFHVENYRGFGYALRTTGAPPPSGRLANLERALRGGSAP